MNYYAQHAINPIAAVALWIMMQVIEKFVSLPNGSDLRL